MIGKHQLNDTVPVRQNFAPVPTAFFHREAHVSVKNSDYHYIRFSFDVDVRRYSRAELYLIYDILFSGDMSRIYQELSEKAGYIYSFVNFVIVQNSF